MTVCQGLISKNTGQNVHETQNKYIVNRKCRKIRQMFVLEVTEVSSGESVTPVVVNYYSSDSASLLSIGRVSVCQPPTVLLRL